LPCLWSAATGEAIGAALAVRALHRSWSGWPSGDPKLPGFDRPGAALSEEVCPFCHPPAERIFHAGDRILGIWDAFPVAPGHALLIPKRHVSDWFEATPEERAELAEATLTAQRRILASAKAKLPDGFTIGINAGEAAGQTVFHLHVHIIPRYRGDVAQPRGGVRNLIPSRGDYLAEPSGSGGASLAADRDDSPPELSPLLIHAPHQRALIAGGDDPLLPHLLAHLDRAERTDIAVAFILRSGVAAIREHLRDLIDRRGRARLVTGDYFDATDPDALVELLDLAEAGDGRFQLKVVECGDRSFHPKAYLFHGPGADGLAYVGSSNLSRSALGSGVEWNYRVVPARDRAGFGDIARAFEKLFGEALPLDADWIDRYRKRRKPASAPLTGVAPEPAPPPPVPHEIQREALLALEATRAEGNSAGIVVLATGLGKTWLSAFDSNRPGFRRVLFVAHREEILTQAMDTYRRIRREAHLGLYTGQEKVPEADVLFASIQTLGRARHLRSFDAAAFDYIVVDEFHHACARTYRQLLDHFDPKFLLGLTATPERSDGGNLLELCQENLVYRCDLFRAIELELLAPFHYFGVPDDVDYSNIPWRSSRFDEEALTTAVATRARAQNALEQLRKRGGKRTLAFCCSKRHADFMTAYFSEAKVRSVAVHSGETSAPRAASLEALRAAELDVVFAVDMFNEGVDLPDVDTILMLRPTESRVLWLQQFGRGLRAAEGKSHLRVIDYIGNHKSFLLKPQTLFDLGSSPHEVAQQLERLQAGGAGLPPGCEVTYDLEAIEILRSLMPSAPPSLQEFYEDFRARYGERPRAVEAYHEGYRPGSLRRSHGSWLRFVRAMGDLSEVQEAALERHGGLLDAIESTPMTRSFKMLVLLAMLNADSFPGSLDLDALAAGVRRIATRSAALAADLGAALDTERELHRLLVENPIAAWTGGKGTGGVSYFRFENGAFSTLSPLEGAGREALQELVRELADWRLAEYLDRPAVARADEIICKVSHAGGRPILFLPDREQHAGVPHGTTPVLVNGEPHEAEFAKVAVNVVQREGGEANRLPEILRGWFGADAGQPGTGFRAAFTRTESGWELKPLGAAEPPTGLELWKAYAREEVPPIFDLPFASTRWQQGFVPVDKDIFLFVTLDKESHPEQHRYEDRFLSPTEVEWQSQNRTTQNGKHGQMIKDHANRGVTIHLFVRREAKRGSRAAPFLYCGPVRFERWEGERPIRVLWALESAVPERLWERLSIPSNLPQG
jgi:superfamily II DNA or RNA helicase/diadenosine tetraphosphate (Ap4A) HIT family hydrolase